MNHDYVSRYKTTIVEEGLSLNVYSNQAIHRGSCQCYGDCDCYRDKGKVTDQGDSYQVVGVPGHYKKCRTIRAAIDQYNSTVNKKPKNELRIFLDKVKNADKID